MIVSSTPNEISQMNIKEKTKKVIQEFLYELPESTRKVIYYCAIPHWFNSEIMSCIKVFDVKLEIDKVYLFISELPFVEKYDDLGFSINTTIREVLLSELWNTDNDTYKDISKKLTAYFGNLINTNDPDLTDIAIESVNIEIYREWIYHLLITNEEEGIKQLNRHLAILKVSSKPSKCLAILNTIEELENTDRVSETTKLWLQYWKLRFSDDSKSLTQRLKNFLSCLNNVKEFGSSTTELAILLYQNLSNILSQLGDKAQAWQEFLNFRRLASRSRVHMSSPIFLYDDIYTKFDFYNPSPWDFLCLGVNQPSSYSHVFIGRERELNNLLLWCMKEETPPTMVIHGLGGVGKTSLAMALVKSVLDKELFQNVYWTSAKKETIVGEEIDLMPDRSDFSHFMRSLLLSNLTDTSIEARHLSVEPVLEKISTYFQEHRVLIVIDNVETLEDAELLRTYLPNILGKSKALVTCRYAFDLPNSQMLKLKGLEEPQSIKLLELGQGTISKKFLASIELYKRFHELSGGHPLMLNLIKDQLNTRKREEILRLVKGETGEIYKFIFDSIWSGISKTAKELLSIITNNQSLTHRELLKREVKLPNSIIDVSLKELERASLIEIKGSSKEDEYYETDPLTRNYVFYHET